MDGLLRGCTPEYGNEWFYNKTLENYEGLSNIYFNQIQNIFIHYSLFYY